MSVKQKIGQAACLGLMVLAVVGCNKKPEPIKTDNSSSIQAKPTDSNGVKTENDLYLERLNKDVTIENPDALLDAVNTDTALKN